MTVTSWPAPAKINLFLHVIGRRQDGYHLLQTVFQFLDYCDELTFTLREDGQINRICNYQDVPEQDDLVIRAARALQDTSGTSIGVDIEINKRLPMGGGLGGGSSNAATVLVGLNKLWQTELSNENLAEIGLRLGADVPVFIYGNAAWGEGVGEKLSPVDVPEQWILVILPGCQVATAKIFNAPDLTRNTPPITIRDFLAGAGHNDCEPVVRSAYPEVASALDWLNELADGKMTGTGACVFAAFPSETAANAALEALPESWQGFVARGINRSPLVDRLAAD